MAAIVLAYDNREIYQYLRQIGCCERCSLRYIGERDSYSYKNVDDSLKLKGLVDFEEPVDGPDLKISKRNPCIVCLGLLEEYTTSLMVKKVADDVLSANYDCDNFACAISLPICLQLRAHSLWVHLTEKFSMLDTRQDIHVTPLKEAWKWTVAPKIATAIGKELDSGAVSEFFIEINMTYSGEQAECACLLEMHPDTFGHRQKQKRRYHGTVFTRKAVETALAATATDHFRRYCECPPSVPEGPGLSCDTVVCAHNPIYLAGRYNKYSRELSQTPWLIDGKRKMVSSVQDFICEDLRLAVRAEGFKFSASGREDVDVRMLGRGRPFVCELMNPRRVKLSRPYIRGLERDINKNSPIVAVRDLQLVHKDELVHLKTGEEKKVKHYRAVCIARERELGQEDLDVLATLGDVTLDQRTPIRVLHRRPLANRTRIVYGMKATLMPALPFPSSGSLFRLDLSTQAGTYVKEFVHGDFGRTRPNLGDMLGGGVDVDILALDVQDIELDWPPPIDYEADQ